VVFPHPEGPQRATVSRGAMRKEIGARRKEVPKFFETSTRASMGREEEGKKKSGQAGGELEREEQGGDIACGTVVQEVVDADHQRGVSGLRH